MERKYRDLYEAMEKMEARGRNWRRIYALALGILVFALSSLALWQGSSFFTRLAVEGPREPQAVFLREVSGDEVFLRGVFRLSSLLVGFLLGFWAYVKSCAYGMYLILEAQRTLVLVDTEQNTAKIAQLLQQENPEARARN